MKSAGVLVLLAALVVIPGWCAPAQAAVVTVGSPLTGPLQDTELCTIDKCTYVQTSLTAPGAQVTSPIDGTIIRWRMRGATQEEGYWLRVMRPTAEEKTFQAVGIAKPGEVIPTAAPVLAPSPLLAPAIELELLLQTFPADVPIQRGDFIGLRMPHNGFLGTTSAGAGVESHVPVEEGESHFFSGAIKEELAYDADVLPPPTIASIAPATGSSGAEVTIVGANFETVRTVSFGGTPAASFSVDSENQITAVVPALGVSAVNIAVRTLAGTATSPEPFIYVPPPTPPTPPGNPGTGNASGAGGASGSGAGSPPVVPPPPARCFVPKLTAKNLQAAKRRSRLAGCAIGKVRKKEGVTAKSGKVVKQTPIPGASLAPGTRIAITLG